MPVQRPQNDNLVDRWLQRSLAERYASTLREPIPEALLRLLCDDKI